MDYADLHIESLEHLAQNFRRKADNPEQTIIEALMLETGMRVRNYRPYSSELRVVRPGQQRGSIIPEDHASDDYMLCVYDGLATVRYQTGQAASWKGVQKARALTRRASMQQAIKQGVEKEYIDWRVAEELLDGIEEDIPTLHRHKHKVQCRPGVYFERVSVGEIPIIVGVVDLFFDHTTPITNSADAINTYADMLEGKMHEEPARVQEEAIANAYNTAADVIDEMAKTYLRAS